MACAPRRSTSLRLCSFGLLLGFAIATVACSTSWQAQLVRAQRYDAQQRPAAALALYDALLPLVPASKPAVVAEIERRRGDCLWQLNRAAEAFTAFQKAVDGDPENLRAQVSLAEV